MLLQQYLLDRSVIVSSTDGYCSCFYHTALPSLQSSTVFTVLLNEDVALTPNLGVCPPLNLSLGVDERG